MFGYLLYFMLIYVGFWLQVGGSQGGSWTLLETNFLTLGGLDWLWGLPWGSSLALGPKMAQRSPQEGSQDRFLSPTWPPDPLQETQLGPTWLQQGPYLAPSWTQLDTTSSHNSHHRNAHTQKPRACIKDQSKRRGRR